jgi:hypothetical protein
MHSVRNSLNLDFDNLKMNILFRVHFELICFLLSIIHYLSDHSVLIYLTKTNWIYDEKVDVINPFKFTEKLSNPLSK